MAGVESLVLVFGVVVLAGLTVWYLVGLYNELVSLYERVEQARQNIDVLLTQRQDELNSLIEAADTFMEHEEDLMVELTEAREAGEQAETPSEKAAADERVRSALSEFNARMENYPDLQSHHNVLQVQNRIANIETQISARREHYNENVTRYNTKIKQIPYVIFASLFGYDDVELFDAPDTATERVDVAAKFN